MVALETFYRGKRVFITGHTGFKGAWLCQWLLAMGCHVTGYSLPPGDEPSLYGLLGLSGHMEPHYGDIRDFGALKRVMAGAKADIVFHLAAQSLVLPSYDDPLETFSTNIMGTANLLECARLEDRARAVLVVVTDKCYENNENHLPFREDDKLGGHDPYSSSKAAAEIVACAYRSSYLAKSGIPMATARAGNVIGGGDFANPRLLPDIVRAAQAGANIFIRNPASIRPWQYVLDVLLGYLMLAQSLHEEGAAFASAYNFGPDKAGATVGVLAQDFIDALGVDIAIETGGAPAPYEARSLMLDTHKAKASLRWTPLMAMDAAVRETAAWYKEYLAAKRPMAEVTSRQLADYTLSIPSSVQGRGESTG